LLVAYEIKNKIERILMESSYRYTYSISLVPTLKR